MIGGFFVVHFSAGGNSGAGVAALANGRVLGGDSAYLYAGQYQQDDNTFKATVDVERFAQGVSIFGNINKFTLQLSGRVEGNEIIASGSIAGQPGMRIDLKLSKKCDI